MDVLQWGLGAKPPVGGLGDEAEAVCRHFFTYFDCRNDQNLKISHKSPPGS